MSPYLVSQTPVFSPRTQFNTMVLAAVIKLTANSYSGLTVWQAGY